MTVPRTTGRIRRIMRSMLHHVVVRSAAIMTIAALVQGGLVGMVIALHVADHHDLLQHDDASCLDAIVHGHEHDRGTPDHDHSVVSAKPAPQRFKRHPLPESPGGASCAVIPARPRVLFAWEGRTESCGPSPPFLPQTSVILRI